MALLRLERQRGDGPGVQAPQGDGLARLFAEAVGAVVETAQGRVDLGDELALPVARAQFELTLGLGRGAVDRKSTRLNSSHSSISYAVFCLKKKKIM